MSEARTYSNPAEALATLPSQFDRARLILALIAYPGHEDGLAAGERGMRTDAPGALFFEAMLDKHLAAYRDRHGRRALKSFISTSSGLWPRKAERWEGTFMRGIKRIRAAEAAYGARLLAQIYGSSLSATLNRLPQHFTNRLAIYSTSQRRSKEAADLPDLLKSCRYSEPIMHLVYGTREAAAEAMLGAGIKLEAPDLRQSMIANSRVLAFLLTHSDEWPDRALSLAETFRRKMAEQAGLSADRLIALS